MVDSESGGESLSFPFGATRCVCWPSATAGDVAELRLEQDVVATAARTVRAAVRDWAAAAGLGPDTIDALVLAVDEAVTNVIDHAYAPEPDLVETPGRAHSRVVVTAASRPCGGGVAVSVVDDGTWRPPPPDPGHRGRGIQVIGGLAQRSTVSPTEHGTTVRMCWARP